jgi:DNA-binding NarL/FixJ family response regulator
MNTPSEIRLLVVDDHFLVRMGLTGSFTLEGDLTVVAECGHGQQAVELYRKHRPDVVVMDARLPGLDGVQATAMICREFPEARVVMLSVCVGEEDIYRAVQAGASAYLSKSVQREELLQAVRAVHAGQRYFPSAIADRLAARVQRENLSPREMEVLKFIVQGASNKEIGAALHISEVTVKQHVGHLLAKLRVNDRTQAATAAIQRGIVHIDE